MIRLTERVVWPSGNSILGAGPVEFTYPLGWCRMCHGDNVLDLWVSPQWLLGR